MHRPNAAALELHSARLKLAAAIRDIDAGYTPQQVRPLLLSADRHLDVAEEGFHNATGGVS